MSTPKGEVERHFSTPVTDSRVMYFDVDIFFAVTAIHPLFSATLRA